MFDALFQYYLTEFYTKGEIVLRTIINLRVPSKIVLINYKRCEPIEKLPEDKKQELFAFAKEMYPNEKRKEELIRICKIVHTIGTLL